MSRFQPALLLLLLVTATLGSGCKKDEPDEPRFDELRLDGDNATGPQLDAGTHRFGVRFSESELRDYVGEELTGIRVFVGAAPVSMRLSVSSGGEVVPGVDLATLQVSSFGNVRRFVDYDLRAPVRIEAGEALWLVAEVELDGDAQQSIGCDSGPRRAGGDWLWSGDRWLTFEERNGESVNWNIRGLVR